MLLNCQPPSRGPPSGVQRLLDARDQRGSWIPSKIFCIRLLKFLTTFLLVIYSKFLTFSHQLSNFTIIRFLAAPPSAASCPGNDIFLFFLVIYLHFFQKTCPLDAPQGGCPGPLHRPHPSLHASGSPCCTQSLWWTTESSPVYADAQG